MEDHFYLDTKNMDAIIDKVHKIAKLMEDTKANYQKEVTRLTQNWVGKSHNMFEKKSAQLLRTLTDVSQSFYDIGENLQTAATAYHEQDMANAKAADGITIRF